MDEAAFCCYYFLYLTRIQRYFLLYRMEWLVVLSTLFKWENAGVYDRRWHYSLCLFIRPACLPQSVKTGSEALKLIGSYWFAVLEYAVLILPPANILSLILKAAGAEKSVYIIAVGCIAFLLMVVLLTRGSWNAWSPIIRTYHVQVPKQAGKLKKLRIAMASDLHLEQLSATGI